MDDETYDKREGTLRSWIKEQKAADPNWKPPKPNGMPQQAVESNRGPPPTAADAAHILVGSRCQVAPGARRGVVKFLGDVPGMPEGVWVGVRLDEPLGKNDGAGPRGIL